MDALPSDESALFIPDILNISLEEFNRIFPDWVKWRATDRRFLPYAGGLRDQPTRVMDGLLYLDSIFQKMLNQYFEQMKKRTQPNG
jgi:hypothetical protein